MGNKGSSLLSFLLGAVVGAAVALLYAPTSGEELRTNIKTEADIRLEKLSAEWEKTVAELQASAENTRTEVMSYIEQMQAKEDVAELEAAEEVSEE